MKTIALTKNLCTTVGDDDYDELSQYKWCASKASMRGPYYAERYTRQIEGKKRKVRMHRAIWERHNFEIQSGYEIDHIDGDSLNNRRCNLRLCTHAQNLRNSKRRKDNISGFRGISLNRRSHKWQATITVDGKTIYLGLSDSPEVVAQIYNAAAKKYHGEFARTTEIP